ncbi:MAG: class I SAM-dependent methyltransferase [Candidatus Riflebacteria bacterium]|nr:class I SAM-dependent methyltransferase [Candidatus Riflebacteria bacterium]
MYNKNTSGEHFETAAINSLLSLYKYFLIDLTNTIKKPVQGLKVLEVGCGPGFMLEQFESAGAKEIIGVDISEDMLQRASKRSAKSVKVQADAADLPFDSNIFDIVFSRGSIFFWSDLDKAFESIRRVTKNGGTIFVGGGYGLSTPEEIIKKIRENRSGSNENKIPRLDPEILCKKAQAYGDFAEILSAPKRGFWLNWKKVDS